MSFSVVAMGPSSASVSMLSPPARVMTGNFLDWHGISYLCCVVEKLRREGVRVIFGAPYEMTDGGTTEGKLCESLLKYGSKALRNASL
jgi:hypothetical protein